MLYAADFYVHALSAFEKWRLYTEQGVCYNMVLMNILGHDENVKKGFT